MTGKDFSGPTPIIKAPTPPTLDVAPAVGTKGDQDEVESQGNLRKQSRTPGVESNGEEIIGSIEDE